MVLVDTNIWIDAFKDPNSISAPVLRVLLPQKLARINGVIRAELLSGAASEAHYRMLESRLLSAPILDDAPDLWERTAWARFRLARNGHQASLLDICIAVTAHYHRVRLWSNDRQFSAIQKVVPFKPFDPSLA
jgi:predicted nucleic acid-binding protein